MKRFAAAFGLLLFALSARAEEYRCPERIETKQSIEAVPTSWTAMGDALNGQQNLEQVEVFDGPPQEGASLVPDNEGNSGDPEWSFAKGNPRRTWMGCFYRQSTQRLIRELPASTRRCVLIFGKREPRQVAGLRCEDANRFTELQDRLEADPMWQNGISPELGLGAKATPAQVVAKLFKKHRILETRKMLIQKGAFTAVLVETDLGPKLVLMKREPTRWWTRVF